MANFTIDAWLNKYLPTVSADVVFRQMFREHLQAIENGSRMLVVFAERGRTLKEDAVLLQRVGSVFGIRGCPQPGVQLQYAAARRPRQLSD